jgi:hypothetical protein
MRPGMACLTWPLGKGAFAKAGSAECAGPLPYVEGVGHVRGARIAIDARDEATQGGSVFEDRFDYGSGDLRVSGQQASGDFQAKGGQGTTAGVVVAGALVKRSEQGAEGKGGIGIENPHHYANGKSHG